MDLPPPGGQTPRVVATQRPSASYLIFIALLFYLITSNNDGGPAIVADESGLNRMRAELLRRVQRRDGLASYLGLDATSAQSLPLEVLPAGLVFLGEEGTTGNLTANATVYAPTPFVPKSGANEVLLPELHSMLDHRAEAIYPQNLTGFVRGTWTPREFSYEELKLDETYNTTSAVERDVEPQSAEETPSKRSLLPITTSLSEAHPPLKARQGLLVVAALAEAAEAANSPLPLRHLVNETTTHNRTVDRGPYPWFKGGKVNLNLREETSTEWEGVAVKEGEILLPLNKSWTGLGPVTFLSGQITFSSHDGLSDFVFDLEAAHFLSQGTVYGWASPQNDRRSQMFNVPGLAFLEQDSTSDDARGRVDAMGRMVLKQIDGRIDKDRQEIEDHVVEPPGAAGGAIGPLFGVDVAPCVFSFYGSVDPLPKEYSTDLYAEYYQSLLHPTGSSLVPPPAPVLRYKMYSENCALVLEGEGTSLSSYRLWEQATSYATAMVLAQGLLLVLLVRQIEWGGASGGGRVAYLTIGTQAAVDSYFFVVHFTVGVATRNRSSLPLLVPAFFALLSSVIFGMRYASSIRAAQPVAIRPPPAPTRVPAAEAPPLPTGEELAAQAAERRAAGAPVEDATDSTEAEAAGPATAPLLAPPQAQPIPLFQAPPASELKYVAIAVSILLFVFTVIMIGGWIPLILGLVFSYWLPQIVHNVQRASAHNSFRAEYIIGTTLARLALPFYFWGMDNVLSIERSRWIYALLGYSFLQAATLLSQDSRLGARWFIPQRALDYWGLVEEKKWDYHPAILSKDAETNAEEEDCPICLEKVELPSKEDRELGRGRRGYMVPPCQHIAHTECLESWLKIKSVCPVCRGRLPSM